MLLLKNDLLYTPAVEVSDFNDCFRKAVKVNGWLRNKKAYAISFNQLGLSERCFVIRKPKKLKLDIDIVMNPSFEPDDGSESIVSDEMCLSFPGRVFKIRRHSKIVARFYDYYQKQERHLNLSGMPAIVFQHEVSHLDGKPDDVICEK